LAEAGITIRAYAPADHDVAAALIQALNIAENAISRDRRQDLGGATEHLDVLLPRLAETGGEMLLAVRGDVVLGLIAWLPEDDDIYVVAPLRRYALVCELIVVESARRQGIAHALLAEVERRARIAGLQRLMIGLVAGNEAALATYAAFGFKPCLVRLAKPLNQP
jgi:GNAT superfamily N-acetyltransferase